LTGDQHTDHISSGQRVSRHSLPTQCFLFFPTAHFLKPILASPHWHIGFCPYPQSPPFGKSQRANLANLQMKIKQFKIVF
jgi:hypothetical protein